MNKGKLGVKPSSVARGTENLISIIDHSLAARSEAVGDGRSGRLQLLAENVRRFGRVVRYKGLEASWTNISLF